MGKKYTSIFLLSTGKDHNARGKEKINSLLQANSHRYVIRQNSIISKGNVNAKHTPQEQKEKQKKQHRRMFTPV